MPQFSKLTVESSHLQHKNTFLKSNRQYLINQQTVLIAPDLPCRTVLRLSEVHARQFWIFSAFYSPLHRIIIQDKKTHQKKSQKADCMGGVNAYGQPDRKISAFFDDFPKLYGVLGTVSAIFHHSWKKGTIVLAVRYQQEVWKKFWS